MLLFHCCSTSSVRHDPMTDTISFFCSVGVTVLAAVGFGVGAGVESHPAMTPIESINEFTILRSCFLRCQRFLIQTMNFSGKTHGRLVFT